MITTEQYDRLKPHRDFIISKRGANSFYETEHTIAWPVIHSIWFQMKGVSLSGNCFDCVQSAYNNFADYITMYEASQNQAAPVTTEPEATEETKPEPAKRGRKPKK